jgi:hypothetical protein
MIAAESDWRIESCASVPAAHGAPPVLAGIVPVSGRTTDFFGTFLETLSRGAKEISRGPGAPQNDPRDGLVLALAERGGAASLADLLLPPLTSLGELMPIIQQLQAFGLVQTNGASVSLTDAGRNVASKLSTPPSSTTLSGTTT